MAIFGKSKKAPTPTTPDQTGGGRGPDTPKGVVGKDKAPKTVSATASGSKAPTRLIRTPLLTEKATEMQAENKYVFLVNKAANKSEVAKEIERLFNVKVEKVNIINKKRKQRLWRRIKGFSPGHKKAIVTVRGDKKIEILPT